MVHSEYGLAMLSEDGPMMLSKDGRAMPSDCGRGWGGLLWNPPEWLYPLGVQNISSAPPVSTPTFFLGSLVPGSGWPVAAQGSMLEPKVRAT